MTLNFSNVEISQGRLQLKDLARGERTNSQRLRIRHASTLQVNVFQLAVCLEVLVSLAQSKLFIGRDQLNQRRERFFSV